MSMLWASLVLGFVYLLAAAFVSITQRGTKWAAGPRDGSTPPLNAVGGRLDRAWKNYLETLPVFVGAVFVQAASGHDSALAPLGAQLYFWGRVAYL
ncbi:MAG: MAPEG family protein, partial [Hyphomonadaceae bacterium]|nr:MAPEG family protein [Hyphomonadaceae bacterium]